MTIRVALYARYSSDNQKDASILDQFRICRERAAKEGWEIAGTYQDARISGASVILRPGVQTMVHDAGRGQFDMVVAEALDRISRDQADTANLFKHLKFLGVPIFTLAEGEINELHVGLKGTMNALFLKDLAAKTHRGMKGRAEAGKAAAGISYGYQAVRAVGSDGQPLTGERTVDPAQGEIVLRIFTEFAAGKTPAAIARDLNGDGVPGPNGQIWQHTTIRGHHDRGTGVLHNELYVGRQIWNRMRYLKDPSTGRRVSRMNPQSEWVITDVPHLRIVPQALWTEVRQRLEVIREKTAPQRNGLQSRVATELVGMRKPKWLLSGLLRCGVCGGSYTMRAANRYACSNRLNGTCTNNRSVKQSQLEESVLAGLRDRMLAPDVADSAMKAFIEEVNKQNHEKRANGQAWQAELVKIQKSIGSMMSAIEDGLYSPEMKARMAELQARKTGLETRLANEAAIEPDVLPSLSALFRSKVERLTEALNVRTERDSAADAIRELIDHIVLAPGDEPDETLATIHGEYSNVLLWLADQCKKAKTPLAFASGVCVIASCELNPITPDGVERLVAGARFELTTFRL